MVGEWLMTKEAVTKALIVDDEAEIRQLVSRFLQKAGHHTETSDSLAAARDQLLTGLYDVVLLDLHLPDGVGFDLIPAIRKHSPKAKVVIITAYEGPEEQHGALLHQVDDYLKKPFTKQQILDTLDRLL